MAANQELQALIAQGLQAAKAGTGVAKKATIDVHKDASNADLKSAIEAGSKQTETWAGRIDRAISEAGPAEDVGNVVLDAVYDVSKKIRQKTSDATSQDLGIIAAGQIALHYWIATFGTLRTYAAQLGMTQTETDLQQCLNEAKQADQQHTQLAEQMLGAVAA